MIIFVHMNTDLILSKEYALFSKKALYVCTYLSSDINISMEVGFYVNKYTFKILD